MMNGHEVNDEETEIRNSICQEISEPQKDEIKEIFRNKFNIQKQLVQIIKQA